MYTITKNTQFDSIEIKFDRKPSQDVINALKNLRFKWHTQKQVWFGYRPQEEIEKVIKALEDGEQMNIAKPIKKGSAKTKNNPFKLGQLFVTSWGYEQTNLNFFQVVEIVGEKSCRVKEVRPRVKEQKSISWGSQDISFENTTEMLEAVPHSIFIKDQEKGDLKRLSKCYNDRTVIDIDGYFAYPYQGETLYESWYA